MSKLNGPLTPASLEAWATWAFRRRMDLHFQRASPTQIDRQQAFTHMSQLVAEAIEMVQSVAKERGGAER